MNPDGLDEAIAYAYNAIAGFNGTSGAIGSSYDPSYMTNSSAYTTRAIRGEMLLVSSRYSEFEFENLTDADIKYRMAQLIAEKLFTSKFIEFTKERDPTTGYVQVRARAFVTPSDDVQILRKTGY